MHEIINKAESRLGRLAKLLSELLTHQLSNFRSSATRFVIRLAILHRFTPRLKCAELVDRESRLRAVERPDPRPSCPKAAAVGRKAASASCGARA